MKHFFRWLLGNEPHYLITVEFTKYTIPVRRRYQKHAGNVISNQYMQMAMQLGKPLELVSAVNTELHKHFPKARNIRIIQVERID